MDTNVVLPENWMPVEGVAILKCLDAQGDPRLLLVATQTLSQWEAVGMLTAALDEIRDSMQKTFVPPDQVDEDG